MGEKDRAFLYQWHLMGKTRVLNVRTPGQMWTMDQFWMAGRITTEIRRFSANLIRPNGDSKPK